jgi:predicted kinase
MAYRALVRAKVTCLDAGTGRSEAAALAVELHTLARQHLRTSSVRLVLVGGLPGTRKSTLAAELCRATGWTLLRSDVVRKELARGGLPDPASGTFGVGLYDPEHTAAVYSELLRGAEPKLRRGHSVLVDASWGRRAWRAAAQGLATRTRSELIELHCRAPQALATAAWPGEPSKPPIPLTPRRRSPSPWPAPSNAGLGQRPLIRPRRSPTWCALSWNVSATPWPKSTAPLAPVPDSRGQTA